MTGKASVNSLTEEVTILREQVKEIPYLKNKIAELFEIVKSLKTQGNVALHTDNDAELVDSKEFNCRKCDFSCSSKTLLNKHVKRNHPRIIECDQCDKIFKDNH